MDTSQRVVKHLRDEKNVRAVKRLNQDLKELEKNPVDFVVARPINDDLFKWTVNMVAASGPWAGMPIHLHLTFLKTYPEDPPEVQLCTPISHHPNVFGGWICLDMIKPPQDYSQPYQGWSSTYTLSSLLIQLYGFLLVDDSIGQLYGNRTVKRSKKKATQVEVDRAIKNIQGCSCGFQDLPNGSTILDLILNTPTSSTPDDASSPPSPSPSSSALSTLTNITSSEGASSPSSPATGTHGHTPSTSSPPSPMPLSFPPCSQPPTSSIPLPCPTELMNLDDHLLRLVLSELSPQDLWRCQRVSRRLARVARDELQRSEQVCFHTKVPYTRAVLGFGISRTWHHDSSNIRSLSTRSDYLSRVAFQEGVRRSAWNVPFDAFLPLYLNPEHGARSLPKLPAYIHGMLRRTCTSGCPLISPQAVQPRELLQVLAQLMNSLVVELVDTRAAKDRGNDGVVAAAKGVTQQMSDAALQTFCHLHHLLLAVALQPGSELLQLARQDVQDFVSRPAARHKSRSPDLGVLLIEYLLVPKSVVPWSEFAPVLLRELLARQVRWIVQSVGDSFAQPGLETTPLKDYNRLKTHFEHGAIGLRLVMLQAWFANALARPDSAATLEQDLKRCKAAYDECSGLPPARVFHKFNAHARGVLKCGSWVEFLAALRVGIRAGREPQGVWLAILKQAVVDSFYAGYHRGPHPMGPRQQQQEQQGQQQQQRTTGTSFVDWRLRPLGVVSDQWL